MATHKRYKDEESIKKFFIESTTYGEGYVQNMIPSYKTTKAQKIFATKPEGSFIGKTNMPKPKTLYYVYFDMNTDFFETLSEHDTFIKTLYNNRNGLDNLKKLTFEITKLVKEYNKPNITMETSTINEYNRKRIIYKNIKYNDVKIKFYDVRDNVVQRVFLSYLRGINSDLSFNQYDDRSTKWMKEISTNTYQENIDYGLTINSNKKLFNNISFCEYFQDTLTVYTIKNPKITNISFGESKMGDFTSNDIEVTFQYESITNDLYANVTLNTDSDKKIDFKVNDTIGIPFGGNYKYYAYFLQLRPVDSEKIKNGLYTEGHKEYEKYSDKLSSSNILIKDRERNTDPSKNVYKVEMYKINKRSNKMRGELFRDTWSIFKSYLNKDVDFSWNTLKNQALDTARKYGFAEEANALSQAELSLKLIKGKSFKENIKYGINAIGDPTTFIGKTEKSFKGMSNNIISKIGGWFD